MMDATVKKYKAVLDALKEGVLLLRDGALCYANAAGRALLPEGNVPEELAGLQAGSMSAGGLEYNVVSPEEGVQLLFLRRTEAEPEQMQLPAGTLAAVYGEILGELLLASHELDARLGPQAPRCRDMLGVVDRSCHRLLRLSRNLQLYDELRQNKRLFPARKEDFTGFFRRVTEEVRDYAFEARRGVEVAYPEEPVLTCFDQELCRELIYHLAVNAIQATAPEDTIRLSLEHAGRRLYLTVEDRGRGIPAEKLPTIFESFAGPDQRPGYDQGFGLGLALCRRIAWFHEGSIALSSREKKGTRVTVSLPLLEPPEGLLRDPGHPVRGEGMENTLVAMSDVLPSDTFR